ncbi:cupin domain-containing protein [Afipia birgiae]|jgi:mannose-6-phosphate isomerase-like protein (cupin superfamily)|uniref:cupin domain-containing protein n=1 Tax=Afipia birgiae TaxID=151414 RepID=UPI0002FA928B|nr:cupin domain-containing protein [Afipia birgiae]
MATTRSATTKSAKTKSAKTKSAKAKSAKAKSAARSVALKKSTQRKKAAVSTSRTKAKPGKPRASAARRAAPKPARPKQRFVVSHHREDDFKADGLRAYAEYRDLGIAKGTHGLARAHVIRLIGPCDPKEVSKLHFHGVEFQMVYVLKGWVKTYLEGQGEILMREGSCWTQPPRIKHLIRDYSDDCELLEVILPADFETVELTA